MQLKLAVVVAYLAVFVWQPGTAFVLSPLLGFAANTWAVLPISLVWLAAPLIDSGTDTSAQDFAGEWNPTPVIILFVIPLVTVLIAVGVALRRAVARIWSRAT